MQDQRRHQRIRFNPPPAIRIGQEGFSGCGYLVNLSLGGVMLRTDLPLRVGEVFGCEFSIFGPALINVCATAVSKIGDCYGARFQSGPMSEWQIRDAIDNALLKGRASILCIHEHGKCRTLCIVGGMNACLRNDFIHGLAHVGINEMDLSGVTKIDSDGMELCRIAVEQHGVVLAHSSPCVLASLKGYLL